MAEEESLLGRQGGYRKLKSFQIAQLIYDITVRFCNRYINIRSRTHDQMVQAARSGVQNIAEGSQAAGTSKKFEIKLTNVARASLEELRLDYEDFLRQRGLPIWPPNHPVLLRFKALRCSSVEQLSDWIQAERAAWPWGDTDLQGPPRSPAPTRTAPKTQEPSPPQSVPHRDRPSSSVPPSLNPKPSSATFAANAALSLLNLCCYFLDRQIAAQAKAFEEEGGFTERMYRVRTTKRKKRW
ncbi:MAG: four helix bundle suffix domain-containing protein [Desulfococcaceae bacterium]